MTGRLRWRLPSGRRKIHTTGTGPLSQGRENWVNKKGNLKPKMARTDTSRNTATSTEDTHLLIGQDRLFINGPFLKLNFALNPERIFSHS